MSSRDLIESAYAANPNLKKRIFDAINATPQHDSLFRDIAQYQLSSHNSNGISTSGHEEPALKKRKLNGSLPLNTGDAAANQSQQPREVVLEARDISFSLPQRKKYHLGIAQYGTDINAPSTTFSIFILTPATNEIELEVPLSDFAYALRLPVPEKTTKQYNFCLLPKNGSASASQQPREPVIWTVPHGPVKTLNIMSSSLSAIASKKAGSDDQILEKALSFVLSRHDIQLTQPSKDEFASAKPESHHKNDTAYHVRAFRGSKEGFLFFLDNGIFFGFKKPLLFFGFENIESVSYTSVLQRTFNLNIAYREGDLNDDQPADIQEIELGMIDQADFPGIDGYIKKHGLQDASLAESRRATKVKTTTNGKSAENGEGAADDEEDGRTELEKAQQQLEDEEDEEEEDYDPSSDDDSAGSGDDSSDAEDEDPEYAKERKRATRSRDLVAEELGSEAEDVSVTEDEDEAEDGEGAEEEEEEYDEEEPEEEDIKPAVTSGFASVAMTGPPPQQRQGRWVQPPPTLPDPDDEDQL
ncbi:hypothetical protein LTR84_001374 [Exophiala bonariae]|uniref:Histone chaperone RTT106/FACT complex subunit SPT16-like middle domain-containing protein n=1 Tax=Exophiala bonariae TaxID=1690606 RepID=A0AAV9NFY9_9EURO|nr:hypothetical protein LTR84_001374 [Exophiala bonariae]